MSMTNRFALWRSPLAGGPILVLLVFVFRSLTPMFDATVASISGVLIVVVAFMLAGQRWAGMAFLVLPIALFASPAGREFSFNLSAVDDPIWRWHSIVGLLSVGVGCVAAVFVALGRPLRVGQRRAPLVASLAGLGLGALMVLAMSALFPHPGYGQSLSSGKIDSLLSSKTPPTCPTRLRSNLSTSTSTYRRADSRSSKSVQTT